MHGTLGRLVFCLSLVASAEAYAGFHAAPPRATELSTSASPHPPASADRLDVAAPSRAEPKSVPTPEPLDLWSNPAMATPGGPRGPTVFRLNQGRAIDVLRRDYPRIFVEKPDLTIFTDEVELHDPSGKRLRGKNQYEKVFDMLRFLRRTTMQDATCTHRVVADDETIRVRWQAKLWMRDPALGIKTLVNGEPALVHIDGVSIYELNSDGLIRAHRLENIVLTGGEQAEQVRLAFAWPQAGFATPELAMPFFRSLDAALQHNAPEGGHVPTRYSARSAPPVMEEGRETPMQRAARERAEDEAKRQRLEALRNPNKGQGGGTNKLPFGLSGPTQCETSYDCDAPMVCCDLLFASVCCTGGILIPTREPEGVLQRQAIPIPVERDNGLPGNGPAGPAGGSAPRYPGPGQF